MKKSKMFIVCTAIMVTGAAYATKSTKAFAPNFYKDEDGIGQPVPNGESGRDSDWKCIASEDDCTYTDQALQNVNEEGTFVLLH